MNTGSSGPTVQQQQLETMQAQQNAQLNLEENATRKSVLNAMLGTRVFRGSALARAVRGNTPGTGGEESAPAPSRSQLYAGSAVPIVANTQSLLDRRESNASGATAAGGAGASAVPTLGGRYGSGSAPNAMRPGSGR